MSFAATLAKRQAATKAAGGDAQVAPAVEPDTTDKEVAQAVADDTSAEKTAEAATNIVPVPWADPDCMACKGSGFNTQGRPCRICDSKAVKNGRKPSSAYTLEPQDDGTFLWFETENPDNCGMSLLPGTEAEAKAETRTEPAANSPATTAEPAANEKPEEQPETQADDKKGRGRPKKGCILCVNCAPITGVERKGSGRHAYYAADILEEIRTQFKNTADQGWWEANVFGRRDVIRENGAEIAAEYGSDLIVFESLGTGDSDLKALYDALRPHAGMVITNSA